MATPSIREALLPSLVIDGAIKPIMIRGTQKLISCPSTYFRVTTTFRIPEVMPEPSVVFRIIPDTIPRITPTRSLNGKLVKKLFFLS